MKALKLLILFCLISISTFAQTAQDEYDKAYRQLTGGINAATVIKTLQNCIDKDKSFEEAYILRAFIYYKLEDYSASIKDYDSLLKINPKNLEGLKKRAFTKIQIKDYAGAVKDHTQRIEVNPNDAVAYFDRAYCQGLLGENKLAISDYSKAIELDGEYSAAYKNRGIASMKLYVHKYADDTVIDDIEDACEDFAKALKLGDKSAREYLLKYCVGE